jgi:hypothetical protein
MIMVGNYVNVVGLFRSLSRALCSVEYATYTKLEEGHTVRQPVHETPLEMIENRRPVQRKQGMSAFQHPQEANKVDVLSGLR